MFSKLDGLTPFLAPCVCLASWGTQRDLGEPGGVGLVGQGAGDLVRERAALAHRGGPGGGHRGDELPGQPGPLGGTAVQCPVQQLAGVVEGDGAGGRGDDRRGAVWRRIASDASPSRSRCRWSAANCWICAAVSCARSWPPPGAPTARNAPSSVAARGRRRRCRRARAAWRLQQVSQVVPQQVAQPPLGDAGQVKVAAPLGEPHPGHGTGGWAAHQARNCSSSASATGTGRPRTAGRAGRAA